MGDRLFHAGPPTPTERANRRRENLAAQAELPAMGTVENGERAATCPACGGTGTACTCDRTGAEALELPAYEER